VSGPAYDTEQPRGRPLLKAAGALVALIGFGLLGALAVNAAFSSIGAEARAARSPMADLREPPAGPRLQADPPAELKGYLAFEREQLTSYGWLDVKDGIVRLPIQRAMELLLKEGLPAREGGK